MRAGGHGNRACRAGRPRLSRLQTRHQHSALSQHDTLITEKQVAPGLEHVYRTREASPGMLVLWAYGSSAGRLEWSFRGIADLVKLAG
jgi:hypothetical protein